MTKEIACKHVTEMMRLSYTRLAKSHRIHLLMDFIRLGRVMSYWTGLKSTCWKIPKNIVIEEDRKRTTWRFVRCEIKVLDRYLLTSSSTEQFPFSLVSKRFTQMIYTTKFRKVSSYILERLSYLKVIRRNHNTLPIFDELLIFQFLLVGQKRPFWVALACAVDKLKSYMIRIESSKRTSVWNLVGRMQTHKCAIVNEWIPIEFMECALNDIAVRRHTMATIVFQFISSKIRRSENILKRMKKNE